MEWFLFSLVALICWSGSDIFSKIGSHPDDSLSHWKMVSAVGLIMGLHAGYEIFFGNVAITFSDMLTYLPASFLYILAMVFGYISLRYIELSISSPICNSSGAVAAVLCILFLGQEISPLAVVAIGIIAVGVIALGVVNLTEDDELHALRQEKANRKYTKSVIAIMLPVIYCLIDAAGTFIDTLLLREEPTGTFFDGVFANTLPEDTANVAYELTFLACGIVAAIYVFLICREPIVPKYDGTKVFGGVCETAGQFAYIYALADTRHAASAAAIISSYCALSTLWGRIFLKEKLSLKHYLAIITVIAGIAVLGFFDV